MINKTSLLTMFRMAFSRAWDKLKSLWDDHGIRRIVYEETTKEGEAAFNWLLCFPIVKQFLGTKTYDEISEKEYKLKVDIFYTGIKMTEENLRRRKLPNMKKLQESNMRALSIHKAKMIANALINGVTDLAYDDIPYFSNATGARKIDNYLAGTGVTLEALSNDLKTARIHGQGFFFNEDPNQEPIGLLHSIVICAPGLEGNFLKIKNSTSDPNQSNPGVANDKSNYIKEIITLPQLSKNPNTWYYGNADIIEPIILLKELIDGQEIRHQIDDTKLVSDHIMLYSAENNFKTGYTFPQLMMRIENA